MERDKVYQILKSSEDNPAFNIFKIEWDRGNGVIERRVAFDGFDSGYKPILHLLDSGDYLNIDRIGGYNSVKSLIRLMTDNPHAEYGSHEPDGMC
jgi:hypothetical protein